MIGACRRFFSKIRDGYSVFLKGSPEGKALVHNSSDD